MRPGAPAGDRLIALPAATVAPALDRLAEGRTPEAALELAHETFGERLALVSSFGAESAALLHIAAGVDRSIPVLFLETGMLFAATIAYRAELAERLGLRDVRRIRPDSGDLRRLDPAGDLHRADPDACCALRKTWPLERALSPFDAVITGRKRHQSGTRAALPVFEADETGRIRINPLAGWDARAVRAYLDRHALPLHPLVTEGFPSIGCAPCTTPVAPGEDARAGRWRGRGKTECGIHFGPGGVVRRAS